MGAPSLYHSHRQEQHGSRRDLYLTKREAIGQNGHPRRWRQGMAVVLAGVYLAVSAFRRPGGKTAPRQADMQ